MLFFFCGNPTSGMCEIRLQNGNFGLQMSQKFVFRSIHVEFGSIHTKNGFS